jgi:hypothetical protein
MYTLEFRMTCIIVSVRLMFLRIVILISVIAVKQGRSDRRCVCVCVGCTPNIAHDQFQVDYQ